MVPRVLGTPGVRYKNLKSGMLNFFNYYIIFVLNIKCKILEVF